MITVDAKTKRTAPREKRIEPLDITVLAGGPGAEREVSLQSGEAVRAALSRLGHHVVICDIDPTDLSALDRSADFVFVALHGEFGEDGTVQAELERRGLPYSGSGATASSLAMDKGASKRCLEAEGIGTPRYDIVTRDTLDALSARFPLPAVVKPVASGSSVDTFIVSTREDLSATAGRLVDKYGQALIEVFVAGPELTVGILDDQALPVCEIRTKRQFYDYEAKYADDETQYLFDLELPPSLLERVQRLSLAAHRALGCEVLSRVDWMVDETTLEPHVLEVNTIPGFTSHSLVPKAAARVGIGFDELCQRIVTSSMRTQRS